MIKPFRSGVQGPDRRTGSSGAGLGSATCDIPQHLVTLHLCRYLCAFSFVPSLLPPFSSSSWTNALLTLSRFEWLRKRCFCCCCFIVVLHSWLWVWQYFFLGKQMCDLNRGFYASLERDGVSPLDHFSSKIIKDVHYVHMTVFFSSLPLKSLFIQ